MSKTKAFFENPPPFGGEKLCCFTLLREDDLISANEVIDLEAVLPFKFADIVAAVLKVAASRPLKTAAF